MLNKLCAIYTTKMFPEIMPDDLKAAHEYNDELIERIYIGRRFKNDTERLDKLFDLPSLNIETNKKADNIMY